MNLLFKNTTRYSKETFDKFSQFHESHFSFRYNLYTFLVIITIIIFIKTISFSTNFLIIILLVIFLFCFLLFRIFRPLDKIRRYEKKDINKKGKSYTFSFYNKYFKVTEKNNSSIFKYRKLYKIYETDLFFYLYTDRVHSLLISKEGFKKGDSLTFRSFIKKKCPFKYKLDKVSFNKK